MIESLLLLLKEIIIYVYNSNQYHLEYISETLKFIFIWKKTLN